MKKTKILLPLAMLALLFGVAACGNNQGGEESKPGEQSQVPGKEEKIKIEAEGGKTKLILGESVQLTASVDGVAWESSDAAVATVSATGLVESKAVGKVTIKASKEGYKEGSINISIDLENIKVTAADNATSVVIGQTLQLNADQQGVTWSSSDNNVATVDQTGKVTGVAFGEVVIKAAKQGFNDGSITLNVVRPAANLKVDLTTGADHYSADGWWELPSAGGYAMQQVDGPTPISQNQSWGQTEEEPDKFVGGFGEGDKETISFTSSITANAEILLNIGNSDAAVLSEIMTIKLNGTPIDLTGIALEAHSVDYGGFVMSSLEFQDVSLGEVKLVTPINTLEFEMLAANNLFLNEVSFYAGQATMALSNPQAKETIEISATEIEVIEGQTIQLNSSVAGVTWMSLNEETATVDQTGLVTGVKMGKVNIRAKKENYYSAQVEITVKPAPVAGQILLEAEAAEELAGIEPGGYVQGQPMIMQDGGQGGWGGSEVHSGGAYVTGYGIDSLTLTFKFTATAAQTMVLSVVGASSAMKSDYSGYEAQALADIMTITLNEQAVNVGEATFPEGGSMMSNPMSEVVIGDVNVQAGENTLVVVLSGGLPSLDVFKLSVKA